MNRQEPMQADLSIRRLYASAVGPWMTRRRAILIFSVITIAGGLYFNWAWLVAAGIAPVLVAVSPCLLMCALGVCDRVWSGGESSEQQKAGTENSVTSTDVEPQKHTVRLHKTHR